MAIFRKEKLISWAQLTNVDLDCSLFNLLNKAQKIFESKLKNSKTKSCGKTKM